MAVVENDNDCLLKIIFSFLWLVCQYVSSARGLRYKHIACLARH
jgi:hypothetical protein